MSHGQLEILESYEVIGRPVVSRSGLTYRPWIEEALRPYRATRVPHGTASGLTALRT